MLRFIDAAEYDLVVEHLAKHPAVAVAAGYAVKFRTSDVVNVLGGATRSSWYEEQEPWFVWALRSAALLAVMRAEQEAESASKRKGPGNG